MRVRFLLLFVVTPFVEMVLLIRLGQWVGFWPTLAIILLTGAIGGVMARSQGLATWQRFQASLSAGRLPTDEIVDGVIILISAALLLTPGVLTDLAGFIGLLPFSRAGIRRLIAKRASTGLIVFGQARWGSTHDSDRRQPDDDDHEWSGEARRTPEHGSSVSSPVPRNTGRRD